MASVKIKIKLAPFPYFRFKISKLFHIINWFKVFYKKKSIGKGIGPWGANFQALVQKHTCMYVWHMHAQMHLMTLQGHLVHLAMVYSQSLHFCGIKHNIQAQKSNFKIILLSVYLIILGQIR